MPLLPAQWSGGWQQISPAAGSAVEWMRSILLSRGRCASADKLGTHPCKTTTLSWLSNAAIDMDTRRLLGYHAKMDEKNPLIYFRNSMPGQIRIFQKFILDIHRGEFMPDNTRSGYFKTRGQDTSKHLLLRLKISRSPGLVSISSLRKTKILRMKRMMRRTRTRSKRQKAQLSEIGSNNEHRQKVLRWAFTEIRSLDNPFFLTINVPPN